MLKLKKNLNFVESVLMIFTLAWLSGVAVAQVPVTDGAAITQRTQILTAQQNFWREQWAEHQRVWAEHENEKTLLIKELWNKKSAAVSGFAWSPSQAPNPSKYHNLYNALLKGQPIPVSAQALNMYRSSTADEYCKLLDSTRKRNACAQKNLIRNEFMLDIQKTNTNTMLRQQQLQNLTSIAKSSGTPRAAQEAQALAGALQADLQLEKTQLDMLNKMYEQIMQVLNDRSQLLDRQALFGK